MRKKQQTIHEKIAEIRERKRVLEDKLLAYGIVLNREHRAMIRETGYIYGEERSCPT